MAVLAVTDLVLMHEILPVQLLTVPQNGLETGLRNFLVPCGAGKNVPLVCQDRQVAMLRLFEG
jgi:hypothetical protein